jgi:hypothetical protein
MSRKNGARDWTEASVLGPPMPAVERARYMRSEIVGVAARRQTADLGSVPVRN